MHEDQNIIKLLRKVDQAEAGQPASVDVFSCRRLAAQKTAARRVAAGATVALVAMVLLVAVSVRQSHLRVGDGGGDTQPSVSAPSLGLAAANDTQREIDMIERTLELYESRARLNSLQHRLTQLTSQPLIPAQVRLQEELNVTAAITLEYAELLANEVNDPLLAAAEYRRVVQQYPGTSWALSAANALAQMP